MSDKQCPSCGGYCPPGPCKMNGGKSSALPACSIALPVITEGIAKEFYPELVDLGIGGYEWNQTAVDFACLLKTHYVKRQ